MKKYTDITERIIANTVLAQDSFYEGTPCWLWLLRAEMNRSGQHYGRMNIKVKGKVKGMLVHRMVVIHIKGRRLTRRVVVRHLCNNTLCCNPAHLVGGTASSNMKQMVRDGRGKNQFGSK